MRIRATFSATLLLPTGPNRFGACPSKSFSDRRPQRIATSAEKRLQGFEIGWRPSWKTFVTDLHDSLACNARTLESREETILTDTAPDLVIPFPRRDRMKELLQAVSP